MRRRARARRRKTGSWCCPANSVTARAAPFVAGALKQRHLQRVARHMAALGCCGAPEVSTQKGIRQRVVPPRQGLHAARLGGGGAPREGRGNGVPAAGCAHRVRRGAARRMARKQHAKSGRRRTQRAKKIFFVAPRRARRARTSAAPRRASASSYSMPVKCGDAGAAAAPKTSRVDTKGRHAAGRKYQRASSALSWHG